MANVYLPPPYPRRILEDLARAIAFAEKSQITIRYDGPGHLDTSTWATDRRLYPPTATGFPPPSEPDEKESGGVGGTPAEPLQSLLEELRIQCSWLTGADYSNAMTLLDRIETALHQPVEPIRQALVKLLWFHGEPLRDNFDEQATYDLCVQVTADARAALHQSETPTSSLTSDRASAKKPEAGDGDRE